MGGRDDPGRLAKQIRQCMTPQAVLTILLIFILIRF